MTPKATFAQKIALRALGDNPQRIEDYTEEEAEARIAELRSAREDTGGADEGTIDFGGEKSQAEGESPEEFAAEVLNQMQQEGATPLEQEQALMDAINMTQGGGEQQGEGEQQEDDEVSEPKPGDRYRVVHSFEYQGRPVRAGETGTVRRYHPMGMYVDLDHDGPSSGLQGVSIERFKPGGNLELTGESEQDEQQQEGSNDMAGQKPKSGGLSGMGQRQKPVLEKRTLREAIERALDDSPTLKDRVFRVIWENRHELSAVLEVPQQISSAVGDIEDRITRTVQQIRDEMGLVLTIEQANGEIVSLEGVHPMFQELIQVATVDQENAYLQGPSGTGKTTAARMLADYLDRPFYMISGSPYISKVDVFGYEDAGGTVHDTPFTLAWKNGGVFLADELDGWHEQTAIMVNSAGENRIVALPGVGMVEAHPDFVFVGAGNTAMTGATRAYEGRRGQDTATRKRWLPIPWEYDRSIETRMAGFDPFGWANYVRRCRTAAAELQYDELVFSSHDIRRGTKLLRRGVPWAQVETRTLFWGVSPDQWRTVKTRAGFDPHYRGECSYEEYQAQIQDEQRGTGADDESFGSETLFDEEEEAVNAD